MQTTTAAIEKKVMDIILDIFPEMSVLVTENGSGEDYNILSELDSIQMLEIMASLEIEYEIFFDEADLNIELFKNLQSLSEYVFQKCCQTAF